jgi:hypothetical protein
LVAPARTPKEIVSQLTAWFTAALQVPEIKAKLVAQGLYPIGKCGADFAAFLRKQYDEFGRVIRERTSRPSETRLHQLQGRTAPPSWLLSTRSGFPDGPSAAENAANHMMPLYSPPRSRASD